VKILQIIGDSYQKEDFHYEAADFYQMVLNIDPDNLGTLFRMRKNFNRLNKDYEIWRIDNKIRRLLSPEEIAIPNSPVDKGKTFSQLLTFDGSIIDLSLHFVPPDGEVLPLISVFFNGQIIWENYLSENVLTIPVKTEAGTNRLEIFPVNRAVDLFKLSYDLEEN